MKRSGIVNAALAAGIARLGHGQQVAVVDCGTPLPRGLDVVDLAVVHGVPPFTAVLDALLAELVIDGALAAAEAGPVVRGWLWERGLEPVFVPHEELKKRIAGVQLVARTGEATPYANVILTCGVPF